MPPPGRLGCGQYAVQLLSQGGNQLLADLPWTGLSFDRERNNVGSASVNISLARADYPNIKARDRCCQDVGYAMPWATELAFFRDGELAWTGPVVEKPSITDQGVTISARDMGQWFERRALLEDHNLPQDLTTLFLAYAKDALDQDPTPNIGFLSALTGTTITPAVLGRDFIRAADAMQDLTRSGLDFATVGRNVYVGDLSALLGDPLTIWDPSKSDGSIAQNGIDMYTQVVVIGKRDQGVDPPVGIAGGIHPTRGLVVLIEQADDLVTQEDVDTAAEKRLAQLGEEAVQATITLSEEAPFGLNALVPGALADTRVQVGCETIQRFLTLNSVNVSAAPGTESVSVTLSTGRVGDRLDQVVAQNAFRIRALERRNP